MTTTSDKMREYREVDASGRRDYIDKKEKLESYISHMDDHASPKIKRKIRSAANNTNQPPDRLERLRDDNLNLKRHRTELESDVTKI